jgi:hypothetical protein
MKRLNKQQAAKHEELSAKLTSGKEELNEAIGQFNTEVEALHEKLLSEKVVALNETIQEANEFAQEIHSEQEDYESERSDKWREGDAGSNYQDWMSAWETEIEELELEEPTPFDEPDIDVEGFANLETEVSS